MNKSSGLDVFLDITEWGLPLFVNFAKGHGVAIVILCLHINILKGEQ